MILEIVEIGEKPRGSAPAGYDVCMRSRMPLVLFALALLVFAVPHAAQASIPYFGPIVPSGTSATCAAGWGMVILVINNLISFLITIAVVFVAPLMIAYAGFLFVVNPFNASGIQKAKDILTNTIIGIVLALAGYLIVDALMGALYNGKAGAWASIINWSSPDGPCLPQKGTEPGAGLTQAPPPTIGTGGTGGLSTSLSTSPGNPCNPATITAAASQAGYPISSNQANMLACVAKGESTCGAMNPPYNLNYSWNKDSGNGKASTAAGAYQVLLSTNSTCYDNPVCEAAAGTPGIPLNCKSGFDSKGFVIPGSPIVSSCQRAAGNVGCSAAAAACLLSKQSFSAAYATDPYAAACQSTYGG